MRLERKSLIACTLLLLTGCSASRQARQADSEYESPDRVPVPVRHADEYDTGRENYDYEYEPAPSRGEESGAPRSSLPPAVPMREPVPAPPAIGVSRVKSVSWLRRFNDSTRNSCGDNTGVDGCTNGSTSPLPPVYFTEGCVTPPNTPVTPSLRSRKKTYPVEVVQGRNLRTRTRAPQHVYTPRNCGEQVAAPGCYAPRGRTGSVQIVSPDDPVWKSNDDSDPKKSGSRNGSVAEPLLEKGWEEKATHREDPGFTPDELMELPSNLEQKPDAKQQSVRHVPYEPEESEIEAAPALPIPAPAVPESPVPVPVEQQLNPDSVNLNTRPPMWPRLGQPAPKPANLPVAAPVMQDDSTLPLIQPSHRI